jgi:hypothetical protein
VQRAERSAPERAERADKCQHTTAHPLARLLLQPFWLLLCPKTIGVPGPNGVGGNRGFAHQDCASVRELGFVIYDRHRWGALVKTVGKAP